MMHSNVPVSKKPKAKLRAVGEVIRKNGDRIPIELSADTDMTQEELIAELQLERDQLANTKEN